MLLKAGFLHRLAIRGAMLCRKAVLLHRFSKAVRLFYYFSIQLLLYG